MEAIILHGGSVVACDHADTRAPALAVRDGRVAAVGALDEVKAAAGSGAKLVDIDGATVLPGLVDTHPHLMHFGVLAEPLVDLSDAVDHEDVVARIAAKAAETPPGEWVMTTPVGEPHYFIRRSWRDLVEGELPDRTVLDGATREHPVPKLRPRAPVVLRLALRGSAFGGGVLLHVDEQERLEFRPLHPDQR